MYVYVHIANFRVVQGYMYVHFCKRSVILVICNIRKTAEKMRFQKNKMSEKRDKKCQKLCRKFEMSEK